MRGLRSLACCCWPRVVLVAPWLSALLPWCALLLAHLVQILNRVRRTLALLHHPKYCMACALQQNACGVLLAALAAQMLA